MVSPGTYNVFLSFRGEDTRNAFTDHLYDALVRAGIVTFRDNEEIRRGEELQPEIERAIKESRASVVVFSEKYATSTWCLDELALILQQRRECNHFVLPVFYHVDPSDVRKQTGTFAIEVKASSRWTDDNVSLWKKALKEVPDLGGMVLSGGKMEVSWRWYDRSLFTASSEKSEAKFVKEIVDIIYNKLERREVSLPQNITGMAARYEDISAWLNQPDVEFLAICGMGGSGKTTLAKYIYNSNWKTYENMSFLEGIREKCEQPDGMRVLQEQLLKGILGGKKRKIPSVSEGTCKIEEALQTKRSLIVLDDIVERSQLVALLGTGKINPQTKIIITTTRENTDDWFKFTDWRCQDYEMKLLNDDESLELLSRHAFGSKVPMEGFKEVAEQAVQYCEGNPLALEVLASALSQKNTIVHWKSQLNTLEKDIHSRIHNVLIMSYNSLSLVLEKELFLHIACFFVGKDKDYVVKILQHDYNAASGITSLSNRCLLSVSPNNKLMMHRLLQEMGKNIVRQESKFPEQRSRVWLSSDSYKILSKGKGSETMEGLALDMQMLEEQKFAFKSSNLKTDALQKMDKLKLLQLNFVQLTGFYENFSEDLRWLCWLGSNLRTIPSDLFMGNLVAIDMSYSNLEIFEPPMVLPSLQILNLTDSHNLLEIRNMSMIPHLETLILWNCHSLSRVCETIGDLTSLALLNMTGCRNLCKSEQMEASTSGKGVAEQPTLFFPRSLHRLFLKDCDLECTESFPLSFSIQLSLQYMNLGNSLFEFLPSYDHLKNLRVLDLSLCSMLKQLLCLPSTLAELYVYYCKSLEEISFQSHRFTLQEFGYEGCISLLEIEGFIKLVPVTKLEENDLGHMKWLKEYQNHEVCLVGDDELTKGRSSCVQMLFEFNIMSTSLPYMKDPMMKPTYVSELSYLYFDVPPPPKNRRLKGLDVTFKYTMSGEDDVLWFCKISTNNDVDLMYNPKVFGKPKFGEVGIWLSYWPIGNALHTGDKVNVSIAVISGLEVHECGVSLVYTDDKVAEETLENNMGLVEVLGGDLSGFQLSTRAYYLCRRDLFELMEVGKLTPGWFSILVGDTIECTEVRGWRKTGRPTQLNPSFTELKFVRCIIHGPESEDIYKIVDMSKSSIVDKKLEFMSSPLGDSMVSSTSSKFTELPIKAVVDSRDQEQEILLLRKHLVDYSIKEAQIHNEKFALEKQIAYMRLAFDQQQQDLADAASKALSYRQDIIEENIRLTYALQDAQEERTTFISSLMPLLAEYSLQPPVADAQSIVSNVKVLFRHLQEKLIGIETKLKESPYQLAAWRSDSSFAQSLLHSFGGNKNGLELVTQQAYSDGDHPTPKGWDGAGVPETSEPDSGRNNNNNNGVRRLGGDSYPTTTSSKNEETSNKQVTFSDPVSSNNDVDDLEGGGEAFVNWNSKTPLEDPQPQPHSHSYSPYLTPVPEKPDSSYSEAAADDDPLPAVESLQISGEAFPGRELQASGYSLNGTTSCNFEWVRHMEDGSVSYIEGAKQQNYLVTADDVDTYLAIEVQPTDNRKRKGELVKVFANEHSKIVCDPDMHDNIRKALQTGHAEHRLSLWTGFLEIWEPVTLVIRKDGINIKGGTTPVNEKFSPNTRVYIPCGNPVEFSIIGLGGVEQRLRVEQESDTISSRDVIVLTLRYFINRAAKKKKVKKKGLFF
ncbi:probable disease resistance protein At4g19520 isoform X3 [Lactuca sativa]|uniref:probable disease resistance protein At4g19520 isoform X3 n=1 Tax=Lactuca sativa TaxID=4236 RepID=UPI000CD96FE5|nr:probable disease resistance protein At4g19520 isoform X3 [Lactuca sativa]